MASDIEREADPVDQADWQKKEFNADDASPAPRPIINPAFESRNRAVFYEGRRVLDAEVVFGVEGGLAVATAAVKARVEIGAGSTFAGRRDEEMIFWFIGSEHIKAGITALWVNVKGFGEAAAMMVVRNLIKNGSGERDALTAHTMLRRAVELKDLLKAHYSTKAGAITPHPDDRLFWKAAESILAAARDALGHEVCVITAASLEAETHTRAKKLYPQ